MVTPRLEALEDRFLPAPMAPLDPTFGTAGTLSGPFSLAGDQVQVTREALQSDGKVVLAGTLKTATTDVGVVRLDSAGNLDPTFGSGGVVRLPSLATGLLAPNVGLAIDSQGRIVVGDETTPSGSAAIFFTAVRLTPSGQPDTTFGTGGTASLQVSPSGNVAGLGLAIGPGNQVLLGGGSDDITTPTATAYVVRLTASGTPDQTFGTGGLATVSYGAGTTGSGSSTPAEELFALPDGHILLAGSVAPLNASGTGGGVVTRLTASGALDPAYAGGAGFILLSAPDNTSAAAVQSDGSVLVSGTLAGSNGSTQAVLDRLTPAGVLDVSFADQGMRPLPVPMQSGFGAQTGSLPFPSTTAQAAVSRIALQPDGKIVVLLQAQNTFGGFRGSNPGNLGGYFLRLLPTGAIDPSFSSAGIEFATAGTATDLAIQPDGKYVVVSYGSGSPLLDFQNGGPTYFVHRFLGATAPAAVRSIAPISVDPATGTWYVRQTAANGTTSVSSVLFGLPGWIPVEGDWDGSGTKGMGVFDPSSATWYLLPSDSTTVTSFQYGAPGWKPVVGDWDGDGVTTVGVVDPSTMTWYLRNTNSAGAPDYTPFAYGAVGWTPVVGDWTGSGHMSVGAFDPATATWYLRGSVSSGAPTIKPFQYGLPGWVPVVGDWGLTFTSTVGVVDPSSGHWYLRKSNSPGSPDAGSFLYGLPGWVPLAGPF
jgi:uncharacterized delta-60 repeat protein